MFGYVLFFSILSIVGLNILKLEELTPFSDQFSLILATITGYIMQLFDSQIMLDKAILRHSVSNFAIEVTEACTAFSVSWLYLSSILAYPWFNFAKKALLMVSGLLLIQVINVLRLISLLYFGHWFEFELFDIFHSYFWPILLNVLILMFFAWILLSQTQPVSLPSSASATAG
jgi:exosortase/archaeosortase family protein